MMYDQRRGWTIPASAGEPSIHIGQAVTSATIPASAGEPHEASAELAVPNDHPRECGGTGLISGLILAGLRPSPRVRGNPLLLRG